MVRPSEGETTTVIYVEMSEVRDRSETGNQEEEEEEEEEVFFFLSGI